jgi:hypothetical protein
MEKATVIALLEKYWRTETTVEEEKALMAWFNSPGPQPGSDHGPGPDGDPDLEPYRALFAYFEQESQVTPGPDFEARILQHIGITEIPAGTAETPAKVRKLHPFRNGLTAAAAIITAITIGLFLLKPAIPDGPGPIAQTPKTAPMIKDTYDDPQQALAAVRHALLIASVHLNEGRKQITK